ncbi:hypothetical protein NVSP9465_01404 [Novosphingobium sp. CECT 9465]|nr:hypothetical protein NVSP9465_01404 [Novosphingobium sp. CECT 9465]
MIERIPFRLELAPTSEHTPLLRAMSVVAHGEPLWPVAGDPEHSVEIQLDDLFAHLTEFWKPLLLRQTYPFALAPSRPSLLASEAAKHWANAPQEQVDEEASELDSFEEAHNIALAFGGLFDLPPLWLVREGEEVLCDSGRSLARVPFGVFQAELERVGNAIARDLLAVDSDKFGAIVQAWEARGKATEVNLVSWSASLEASVAEMLIAKGLIAPPASLDEAANDDDELLIAARVAGALPTDLIVEILGVARQFERRDAPELDAISADAADFLAGCQDYEPFAQGEALADFVRERSGLSASEPIDVFAFTQALGIEVQVAAVGPSTFDGLAIAGPRYGPGAFINRASGRIRDKDAEDLRSDPGARVTLAHELCHQLVDREHSLSAVEVLRSRMPSRIESRARAFAGQFLLPSVTAAQIWDSAGSPVDRSGLQDVLQALVDHYGVSFSVASWKLQHGARWAVENMSGETFRSLRAMLDIIAAYR